MRSRLTAILLALAATALLLAGCGDDGGDDGGTAEADLARYAPADALAFGQIAVKPEGSLSDSVNSILERFPNGDRAGDELVKSLNESLADDGLTYEDNIEPWLGQNVGGYITGLDFAGDGEPQVSDDQFVVLIEATDEDRALQELTENAKKDGKVRTQPYKGVEITEQVTGDDPATFAVSGGVVLLSGSVAGVRGALDATEGETLDSNPDLNGFLSDRQGDTMAVGYADVAGIIDAVEKSGAVPKAQLDAILKSYSPSAEKPALAALDVESSKVTFDVSAGASEGISPEESSLVEGLPGDAWAVLGLGDIGGYVENFTKQLSSFGTEGFGAAQINRILQRQAGFTLDDLGILGDAAFFASGESILELQVGGIFEAQPGAARDRLLAAIRRAALRSGEAKLGTLDVPDSEGFSLRPSEFPAPINVATRGDKLVIAVGDTATEALLDGQGDSQAVQTARDALGGSGFAVAFGLQMEPVLELVENSGGSDDAEFVETRKYLEQFSTVAAGTETSEDETLFRFVVELTDE